MESLKVIKNLLDIGIDLGVENFAITSKESFFSMPKEKYDFDLIDFIGRISEEHKAPNDIYRVLIGQFPIAKLLFRRYPQKIMDIIMIVLRNPNS